MNEENPAIASTESIDSLLASTKRVYQKEMQKNPMAVLSAGDAFDGDLTSAEELEAAGFNEPQRDSSFRLSREWGPILIP